MVYPQYKRCLTDNKWTLRQLVRKCKFNLTVHRHLWMIGLRELCGLDKSVWQLRFLLQRSSVKMK